MIGDSPALVRRSGRHDADVREGRIWRRCGYRSESDRLREALLFWPPDTLADSAEPEKRLLNAAPDLNLLRRQAKALVTCLEENGVEVHLFASAEAPPNIIFARDLCFVTPEGAILARPVAEQRSAEPSVMARFLAALRVPILRSITGTGTFEGADALWIDRDRVLIGVGGRTNMEGAEQVAEALACQGVDCVTVPLTGEVQHLLGAINFVDPQLAVFNARSGVALGQLAATYGLKLLRIDDVTAIRDQRALNFVTIAPNKVVAPMMDCRIYKLLEAHGIDVIQLDISEYLKCAGGIACAVSIIRRE